jgi:acyl carrier protein
MNLSPNFPDDQVMHLLMQLLHEELGLPERKTINLTTSINFDLGCNGADARHLMESLEQQFGIDLDDYDAYRYFQPEGFDVHLKRKAKGRGDKIPLTIGMLYQAIKMQRWDTQQLEGIEPNT